MMGLLEEAAILQTALNRDGYRFCFIGGIAVQCWGEPRYTQDLDLQLAVAFGHELEAAKKLSGTVVGRVDDAIEFAGRSRVFLGQTSSGTPVDVVFAGTDYEERILARSSIQAEFGIRVCSAEDLVVMKAFAARDRDWIDVESILTRQGSHLDWQLVESELQLLVALRDETALPARLLSLRGR